MVTILNCLVIIPRFLQDRSRFLILSPDFAVGNELVMVRGTPLLAVTKIKYTDSEKLMLKFSVFEPFLYRLAPNFKPIRLLTLVL